MKFDFSDVHILGGGSLAGTCCTSWVIWVCILRYPRKAWCSNVFNPSVSLKADGREEKKNPRSPEPAELASAVTKGHDSIKVDRHGPTPKGCSSISTHEPRCGMCLCSHMLTWTPHPHVFLQNLVPSTVLFSRLPPFTSCFSRFILSLTPWIAKHFREKYLLYSHKI